MPSIGPMELVVVLVIALLVLGPKRLPEAGRSLGDGLRGFKNSLSGEDPQPTASETSGRASGQDDARRMVDTNPTA